MRSRCAAAEGERPNRDSVVAFSVGQIFFWFGGKAPPATADCPCEFILVGKKKEISPQKRQPQKREAKGALALCGPVRVVDLFWSRHKRTGRCALAAPPLTGHDPNRDSVVALSVGQISFWFGGKRPRIG